MPIYRFICQDCGKDFDVLISHSRKSSVKCPDCGSFRLKEDFKGYGSQGSSGSESSRRVRASGCG